MKASKLVLLLLAILLFVGCARIRYQSLINYDMLESAADHARRELSRKEVVAVANTIYQRAMDERRYVDALKAVKNYHLGDEKFTDAAIELYNFYKDGLQWEKALEVAREYHLGEKAVRKAVVRLYNEIYDRRQWRKAFELRLLWSDDLRESHLDQARIGICKELIFKGEFEEIDKIAKRYGLDRATIRRAAYAVFKQYAKEEETDKALQIAEKYRLKGLEVSRQETIKLLEELK